MTNIAVIIPSLGRAAMLHETVGSVLRQTAPPNRIVICVTSDADILPATPALSSSIAVVRAEKGITRQRNRAIQALPPDAELVTFLDDDVELHPDYLRRIAQAFAAHPDLVLASGRELLLGPHSQEIERAEAQAVLRGEAGATDLPLVVRSTHIYYDVTGCNMSVRRRVLDRLQFDERLPLYGWMEDFDFSLACARHGRVARIENGRLVHLVSPGGRPNAKRLGFCQVMNPIYIWSKRYPDYGLPLLLALVGRVIAANLVRLATSPAEARQRWQRLVGNAIALGMLARGRLSPEYMAEL